MATAMDKWGVAQEPYDEVDDTQEGDASGVQDENPDDEFEPVINAATSAADAEAAAHAAKKAKDMKFLMLSGAVVALIAAGVVGVKYFGSADVAPEASPTMYQGQAPAGLAPMAPVAAVVPFEPTVPTAQTAPTTGTLTATTATSTTSPVAAPAPMGQPGMDPTQGVGSVPAPQLTPSPDSTPSQPTPISATPTFTTGPSVASTSQNDEATQLQSVIVSKDQEIARLRRELAANKRPVVKAKAPREVVKAKASPDEEFVIPSMTTKTGVASKPEVDKRPAIRVDSTGAKVVDPLVVSDTKQTAVESQPITKKGRVRNEFTVYAISNGRAWVTWANDGLNYTVGVNSQLPDSSRVTSIDDVTGVVHTNGGEIHPKPPTK